jgi:hypothetical protein
MPRGSTIWLDTAANKTDPFMVASIVIPAFFIVMWVVAEFRSPRWVRIALGIAGMVCLVGMATIVGFTGRIELADHYRTANNNLAYAIEAAIKDGRSDRVIAVLSPLRNQNNFDLGTPPDYYRVIQSAADQISSHNNDGR